MTAAAVIRLPALPERKKVVQMASNDGQPERFKDAVRRLFLDRDEYLTQTGNINWMLVSEALPDVYYETLRKAIAGDRRPTADLMEKVATLAGVQPDVFAEYQLEQARRQFDPKEVGMETAMANLQAWASANTRQRKKR